MPKTIYRKDYQPPVFSVESIALDFDLYDDHALVTNQMQLKRQREGGLHLCGDELELLSIAMNGQGLAADAYELREGNLIIPICPDEFSLSIVTRIRPQDNTSLSGLYRSRQMFCTQCEAEGFRRMTFYPDRPDVLSIFTTKIHADKRQYPVLLSNGNLVASGDEANGRHWVLWEDPFKKPSYLFALVAGNLVQISDEFITASKRRVDLHIFVEPGNENKCQHAMNSLQKAMRWDEVEYGREYDLDIFMIVAVSDFNMGAMENKGLNIFNSKYILARPDTATDVDYANIEGVVGHEYFHNWTGNRITCRDWFQLSLKEGLTVFRDQEFSRDMNSRDVNRILDVKVLRNTQFPEDAGAMAHPVRPESYQEINNFYTATVYNKGAEVIRMQQTLLGKEGFRRGMDLYFARHDGQAVTIDDFVAAMEDANAVDLTQFKLWYSQAGTPEIAVKSDYRSGELTLTLAQTCRPTPECKDKKPFHIPIRIALFDEQGKQMPLATQVLELREREQTFTFTGLQSRPIVSLLREFSAPVILKQIQSQEDLLALLQFETDGFAKWNAAQCLALNCVQSFYRSAKEQWCIPENLIKAYRFVLQDSDQDAALRAELLNPPGFEEAAAELAAVDVGLLEEARDSYRAQLGAALFDDAWQCYEVLWQEEDHAMHGVAYNRRKLRNISLWLLMKGDEARALHLCHDQFVKAQTMTDQIASLSLLVNAEHAEMREKALSAFYAQWSHDDLVLDKWFVLQATSELPGTLERVKKLLAHPAFNMKNPNKVRSLIGAFSQGNPRHFHAADGSGYVFLTDMLLQIDKYNPQVSARLATPFTRWRKFAVDRQHLMKEQLQRLSSLDLSKDLQELVEKSLQD
ncbi:aminopeptidase N [Legionella sp. 27cVA30]|uniref:aminopeptidase N n=1 Tax=Legionella TaxID=445 RepID=UPI000F8F504E|nr:MULTISPECIES: aminopeptidase N [Legionella]MCP0912809.1 aminopeptidase N [Legionella sp. 27cVA30]RUR16300.1 aminopeptidase N [Legionella septentrionalis]